MADSKPNTRMQCGIDPTGKVRPVAVDSAGRQLYVGVQVTSPASIVSADLASVDAHANTVSARIVSVSAELVSLLASVEHRLSARIDTASGAGGGGSVTSTEVSAGDAAVSAQAASARNVVSQRVVSVSAELASLVQIASAAATSANNHASIASAAATSVDSRLNAVSANPIGQGGPYIGLQTIINALSAWSSAIETSIETNSARMTSISAELASLVQVASAAATSADAHAAAASAAATSVLAGISAVSARSTGNVSTRGLQSVVDALSNRISAAGGGGGGSVTSTELSAVSAQAKSAIDVVSARVVSVSAELGSLVQIASAAATSADGHANTVSARAVSISAELASLVQIASAAATSADGHANTVSQRVVSVSNELGSLLASASANLVSIIEASVSNEASLRNVVSLDLISSKARRAFNTANQASITVSTGITVSGVSIALTSGQTYEFQFQIPFTALSPAGIVVAVLGPTVNRFAVTYAIPGPGVAGFAGGANVILGCPSPAGPGTKMSATSITATGVTLMAGAWGIINPSANGSIKFLIGPNISGAANSGVVVLRGAYVEVFRTE